MKRNSLLAEKRTKTLNSIKDAENSKPVFIDYNEKIVQLSSILDILQSQDISPAIKNNFLKSTILKIDYSCQKYNHQQEESTFDLRVFFNL